jgi:UrcA family protein
MTKTSPFASAPFALAVALVTSPLAAEAPMTVTGQPVIQESVSYDDLDLRKWGAQQTLKARVFRTADRLCARADGPFATNGFGLGSSPTCSDLTYLDARPQIAAAIQRAKAGQQLAAISIAVSARWAR